MHYTIEAKADLLHARVWGRDTDEPPFQVCKAILSEALRLRLSRVLVELRQKVPLSAVSQFRVVERLPELGVTAKCRIALVHHTPGLYEASDMLDLAAGNRGLNVKNFRDLDSALAWLG
ncbi:MAG: hypothetical protein AB1452_03800 [Pseudomonadota bacterium]